MNLDDLDLAELKRLLRDVSKAIDTFEHRQKSAALAKVQALAQEHGFKLAELMDVRHPVAPKYATLPIRRRHGPGAVASRVGCLRRWTPGSRWTIWRSERTRRRYGAARCAVRRVAVHASASFNP